METGKKISVIIPVLNEEEDLPETLEFLQGSRSRGHEVILVDGGSTDNTIAMAGSLVDIVSSTNHGRGNQMNVGAGLASGDILLFLHADTLLMSDYDEILGQQEIADRWGFFKVRLSGSHWMFRIIEWFMNQRCRVTGVVTGDHCIFIDRQLFHKAGCFAPVMLMEDLEISSRLLKSSRPFFISKTVVTSSRRWERNGIFRTIILMWKLRLAWYLGTDTADLARQYD